MKVTLEVNVSDHPEYCHEKGIANLYIHGREYCEYYYAGECELIRDSDGKMLSLTIIDNTAIRCDKCKKLVPTKT